MAISRRQQRLVHVARKRLGLSDAEYAALLAGAGNVTSSSELDRDGFEAFVGACEHLGFVAHCPMGPAYGDRPGFASDRQIALIRALWFEYTRGQAGEAELAKWLRAKWRVSSLRFLTAAQAPKAITALKAMKGRAA